MAEVAAALVACTTGAALGEVVVVRPGWEPLPLRFPGVPGRAYRGEAMPALLARRPIGTRRTSL
ncbi:hypothetical protein [Amycolatopsis sp. A1MSW2902]|uniref:hypothetical protein n=1 Tax=Amycolatopsis sp. A1MSW2902 TaxID=687413 RepID=UPI00307E346F